MLYTNIMTLLNLKGTYAICVFYVSLVRRLSIYTPKT